VTPTPDASFYAVDPTFRFFYSQLGGKEILGEVISPVREINGVKSQYTVNGLMIYDPHAADTRIFQLGAIGRHLDLDIAPGEPQVAASFLTLYKQLGGEDFVGKPLTPQHYNQSKSRFEQYFENLGFYQGTETGGIPRLMPYGAWQCSSECQNSLPQNLLPLLPTPTHGSSPAPEAVTPLVPTDPPLVVRTPSQPVAARELVMQVWETKPLIASDEEQEVALSLEADNAPLVGVVAELVVTLPDGARKSYQFPPTGADGHARLQIPAVTALNGTVVHYRVCIDRPTGERYCVKDSYTIWTGP
jgi:hypothetical protein